MKKHLPYFLALIVPLLSIDLLFITYFNCPTSSPFVLAILETFICLSSVFFFVYGTKYFLSEKSILLHFLTFLIVDILIFLNSYSVYFLYCFLFNFTDIPELDAVYCMIYAWLLFSFFAFIMMIVIHNRNKAFIKGNKSFPILLSLILFALFSILLQNVHGSFLLEEFPSVRDTRYASMATALVFTLGALVLAFSFLLAFFSLRAKEKKTRILFSLSLIPSLFVPIYSFSKIQDFGSHDRITIVSYVLFVYLLPFICFLFGMVSFLLNSVSKKKNVPETI